MAGSRIKNATRNMRALILGTLVSMVLPFVSRTVMIGTLGALYLGLNSIFTSVLSVLSLAELGVGSAMVFSMYEPIAKGDTETVCALLNLYKKLYRIIGCIILVAGIAFVPFLHLVIEGETPDAVNLHILYLIHLFNAVISYFLFAYKTCLFTASQRVDIDKNIGTVVIILLNIVQIVVMLLFHNYYVYSIVLPVSTIIANLVKSHYADKMFPEYRAFGEVSKQLKDNIKKQVAGLFIYKLSNVLRSSLDSLVLSAFLGLTVLAKYNNYYYIMTTIGGFVGIITASITSGIGDSIARDSQEKNYNDFKKIQFLYMWISGFCTVSLFCLYQPFMELWVGSELMLDNVSMSVFCIYFLVSRWGEVCYTYRQSAGLWWRDKVRPIVEGIVNLILNVILVRVIGVTGVLLSTIVCLVFIHAFWGSRTLYKYYFTNFKQSEYILKLLFYALVIIFAAGVTGGLCSLLPQVEWTFVGIISFCGRGLLCIAVPNLIFFLIYRKMPEFIEVKTLLKNMLKR